MDSYIQWLIRFSPESASVWGFREADSYISLCTDEQFHTSQTHLLDWITHHPSESNRIQYKLNHLMYHDTIPYTNVFEMIYNGIKSLPARSPAIHTRLCAYAGVDRTPLTVQLQQWIQDRSDLRFPYYKEIKKDLESVPMYMTFLKTQCESYPEWPLLERQLNQFRDFIIQFIQPHARTDFRMRISIYHTVLDQYGIKMSIETLLQQAQQDRITIQKDIAQLVRLIAKKNGWPSSYPAVLQQIQAHQIAADQMISHYHQRLTEIEHILRTHRLLNVPDVPCRIRYATPEENMVPIPFYNSPALHESTRGEFVVPLSSMDDTGTEAGSWSIVVHEARPGHELQFNRYQHRSLLEKMCGWTAAHSEGWALYAEYLMYPHMPMEAQLLSLKYKWLRVVRTLFDIQLNDGQITVAEALAYLIQTMGLSEDMAQLEIDRMTFLSRGQSVSYYAGFCMILEKRVEYFIAHPHATLYDFHEWLLELPPEQWFG